VAARGHRRAPVILRHAIRRHGQPC
jgi:hypothetical protein